MKDNLSKEIGRTIQLYRKKKGKTMMQLGQDVGLGRQQIGHYESGLHNITVSRLLDISKALETHFSKFLPIDLRK